MLRGKDTQLTLYFLVAILNISPLDGSSLIEYDPLTEEYKQIFHAQFEGNDRDRFIREFWKLAVRESSDTFYSFYILSSDTTIRRTTGGHTTTPSTGSYDAIAPENAIDIVNRNRVNIIEVNIPKVLTDTDFNVTTNTINGHTIAGSQRSTNPATSSVFVPPDQVLKPQLAHHYHLTNARVLNMLPDSRRNLVWHDNTDPTKSGLYYAYVKTTVDSDSPKVFGVARATSSSDRKAIVEVEIDDLENHAGIDFDIDHESNILYGAITFRDRKTSCMTEFEKVL